ncbi:MAG: acetylornithine/succinylornithine family transaminase [Defluviitaleaceae bacterium]|nr:acetylornithine/succinylornithine family transaminase [Defluviitaleaceae bacterium]
MQLKDTGKSAQEIKDIVSKYMVETYKRFDFICEKAEGHYLYAENGDKYLDFFGGVAVNNTGSCNPKVVAAVKEQVEQVMHTFNYPYTVPQAMLAERVCTTLGFDKIFYQNSGTEANEAMIKMARKYGIEKKGPNAYHIITGKGSFHGRTFGALSATGQPGTVLHNNFGPMLEGFTYAEFGNLAEYESQITENTCAIMFEPIQAEGGVKVPTKEFIQGLEALCKKHNLLLLADEIQTGWCRTGETMGYMNFGVKPDIISMAKGIGGGMPIGAICCNDEVASVFTLGTHGTTYGGNSVCCAAAYAQVGVLMDDNYSAKAKEMGAYIMEKLQSVPKLKEVRGYGLLIGVELTEAISVQVKEEAIKRKLLTTSIGTNIVRLTPPLTITKAECDEAVNILTEAINAIQ